MTKFDKLYNLIMQQQVQYHMNSGQKEILTRCISDFIKDKNKEYFLKGLCNLIYRGFVRHHGKEKEDEWATTETIMAHHKRMKPIYNEKIQTVYDPYSKTERQSSPAFGWYQFTFKGQKRKDHDGNYNLYYTIDTSTEENVIRFQDALVDLKERIIKYGMEHGKPYLAFKTLSNAHQIVCDKDHIKFYFSDPNLKDDMKKLANKWFSDHKIQLMERPYSQGKDTLEDSYGMRKCKKVAQEVADWIQQYGDKYTAQQYVKALQKYMYEWLKK